MRGEIWKICSVQQTIISPTDKQQRYFSTQKAVHDTKLIEHDFFLFSDAAGLSFSNPFSPSPLNGPPLRLFIVYYIATLMFRSV